MRIAITGATGLVGRFVAEEALAAGDDVLSLSRGGPRRGFFSRAVTHIPFALDGPVPDLAGCDALVHLAFQHVPGRYRGGEGEDPHGFRRANLDGSRRLFDAARAAGVGRILFLSSRAVYGDYPAGTRLTEALSPRPDTLYGRVKHEAEVHLATLHCADCATASLRATGIYGPAGMGQRHKWQDLFEDFLSGREIAPRVATELHGDDLARGVRILLDTQPEGLGGRGFNLSDLLLDRRDLLSAVAAMTGMSGRLPERSESGRVSEMDCSALRALGWTPGGLTQLYMTLPELLAPLRLK